MTEVDIDVASVLFDHAGVYCQVNSSLWCVWKKLVRVGQRYFSQWRPGSLL